MYTKYTVLKDCERLYHQIFRTSFPDFKCSCENVLLSHLKVHERENC
jgi:hypothetical protein